VYKLFRNKFFVPATWYTSLEDTTIILWLGCDKGGATMPFKFGLTVMNCPKLNLPESFDLIATMEAFDTYTNLQDGIFEHYKDELDCLCKVSPELAPTVFVLLDSSNLPLLVRIHWGHTMSNPLTWPIIVMEAGAVHSHNISWAHRNSNVHVALCCDGHDEVWGIALLDEHGVVQMVSEFKT